MQQADEAYVTVRRYIYQHPGKARFADIVQETGVSEKQLNYLIDQGRIVLGDVPGGQARCRVCGTATTGDALCSSCREKLIAAKLLSGPTDGRQTENRAESWKTQPLRKPKL
jgi:hypothetical protein